MSESVKYLLDESRLPREWYNIVADLPRPPDPVLHPGTLQPVGPADLEPLFPMALIAQEVATERAIEIPEPIREVYRQSRPSRLYRARRLERALDPPAKIYYGWPETALRCGVDATGLMPILLALAKVLTNPHLCSFEEKRRWRGLLASTFQIKSGSRSG